MASRLKLHEVLCDALGSRNVYYQPPESVKIEYPAIVYSKSDVDKLSANDAAYKLTNCYDVIVIDKKPDNPVIAKLLQLPMCSFSRNYKADNLNHDSLKLYY